VAASDSWPDSLPLRPEQLLHFIELRPFTTAWDKELNLGDTALNILQFKLMKNPAAGAVIPRTGGLRKLRFAPPEWNVGKRGAVRVCYVHFPRFGIVLLAMAYTKNRKDDLSAREKAAIRELIHEIEVEILHSKGLL
jgi:hypothetical protein